MSSIESIQLATEVSSVWGPGEIEAAVSRITAGAVVAFLLFRFVLGVKWPRPFRLRFALLNIGGALTTGIVWLGLSLVIESLLIGSLQEAHAAGGWLDYLFLGTFLYAVIAGITYSLNATERAARAEAAAARTQLAALQAQLHPHFLFNALHAVVQLIPTDPQRAVVAAELVASLLRTTVEEERNEVTLGEEWEFVSRYLEVEHIRFGDRLRIGESFESELLDEPFPSFALQTLVENAVRHGAANRVEPTEIMITATGTDSTLELSVRNTGGRLPGGAEGHTPGTGLTRLRERLTVLYGSAAHLACHVLEDGRFEAVVVVPRLSRKP
jgi:two-component system, LytTR family, sensor kinase